MLGHSSIKVTQDTYGNLYDEDPKALASLMADKVAAEGKCHLFCHRERI
jgi:hypothetical protein